MTYLFLYAIGIFVVWHTYKYGFIDTVKKLVNILLPSFLIIVFNIKTGRLLFKTPLIGILSILPTSIFIYRVSQPFLSLFNSWIDNSTDKKEDMENVVEAEVINIDE